MTDSRDLMTQHEHDTVERLGSLASDFKKIMGGNDLEIQADLVEAINHIHGLQNMVLSQAARRAYWDKYRMLGKKGS